MKAVIMAGGKGTRISSVVSEVPKPMIMINDKPVLEYEISVLREQGINEIIITVSHMANQIMDYFGDGSKWDVSIEYYLEEQPLGNAGALYIIKDKLTDDFLLLNADYIFDINIKRFFDYHKEKGGLVTLFTHPNNHPYDSGLLITDENKAVVKWVNKEDEHPKWYRNRVNAGIQLINPQCLDLVDVRPYEIGKTIDGKTYKVDLDRDVLKPLCKLGKVFCYDSTEYVKDMGTPDRLKIVSEDVISGLVNAKKMGNKQKAIFLDRDGTINKYIGFLRNIDDFELLPGVSKAIGRINRLGYLVIVVTNQPVIARGEVTSEQLEEIHNKMETLLGRDGAYVDAIYVCPHHPDKGFEGEIKELKIDCDCRKPKPGLLLQAASDYCVDLKQSWMVGDDERDIAAGKNAGCKTTLIGDDLFGQDISVKSLEEFVNKILVAANC